MSDLSPRLSTQELELEGGQLLPNKEVLSILDLLVNVDLALDLAAPIDLAVAANLNVAAPVEASASANVLAFGSESLAVADQGTMIDQYLSGEATATAPQDATIDQSDDTVGDGTGTGTGEGTVGEQTGEQLAPAPGSGDGSTPAVGDSGAEAADGVNAQAIELPTSDSDLLSGPLLNVDVDIALDADLVAPVAGAVAANANAAVPIDAAVSANIGTVDSQSIAIAEQDAIINQKLEDVTASATADQTADVTQ